MFYFLKTLLKSAAAAYGFIDPQPISRIETNSFRQPTYPSLYPSIDNSNLDIEQPKTNKLKPLPLYRQILSSPASSKIIRKSTIGQLLSIQYGEGLFIFGNKLYPIDSQLYRLMHLRNNGQVTPQNRSMSIISSSPVKPASWYSSIFSRLLTPDSVQNTRSPSPTLAIQDAPTERVGLSTWVNWVINGARSFFVVETTTQPTAAVTPPLAIHNEETQPQIPVEAQQAETIAPAIAERTMSFSKSEIYNLLSSPEVLQDMITSGQLKISPLTTNPPEDVLQEFEVSLSGYKTTGFLSNDENGAVTFKIGGIVIPIQDIQHAFNLTESTADNFNESDLRVVEVLDSDDSRVINEENLRSARRSAHEDTNEEQNDLPISRRILLDEDELQPNLASLARLRGLVSSLEPTIRPAVNDVLKQIEQLSKDGEDPTKIEELILLTEKLITAGPGEERSEIAAEYQQTAKTMRSNSSIMWQALGASMLILGAAILAIGLALIFTTPATIPGAILTAGGAGLLLASAGIFASNRKNIASSMTKLATIIENSDDDEDEDNLELERRSISLSTN